MSLTRNQKISETLVKPAVAGVIAGITAPFLFGIDMKDKINFLGLFDINVMLGVGGAAALGTALGTVSKDWILPYIPRNSKWAEMEGMIITPVLSGLGTTLLLIKNVDGTPASYFKVFALGAGSAIGSDYLSRTFLTNLIQ